MIMENKILKKSLPCSGKSYDSVVFERTDSFNQSYFNCDFINCHFSSCRLEEVVFKGCRFRDCYFESCDLSNICVEDSLFNATKFFECKVIGVNWTSAQWPKYDLSCDL